MVRPTPEGLLTKMPMIRCPRCELRQYVAASSAAPRRCCDCGRPLDLETSDLIASAIAVRTDLRRLGTRAARRFGHGNVSDRS